MSFYDKMGIFCAGFLIARIIYEGYRRIRAEREVEYLRGIIAATIARLNRETTTQYEIAAMYADERMKGRQ